MKKIKKTAISGVLTALCVIFLLIGSLFQTLDLSAAGLGSIIVLIAMIELGKSWAFGVYISSSVLSLILLPNKSAAFIFALLVGFYPILKTPLNKIKPIFLSYLARIAFFNFALSLLMCLFVFLLPIYYDFVGFEIAIYLLGNLTFIVYDFALERVAVTYIIRIKPMLFGKR
jgi:hypothetical protein